MIHRSRFVQAPPRTGALFSVFLLLLGLAAPAGATVVDLCADLDGDQVVPAVVTAGTGVGTMSYDDVSNELCVTLSAVDLTGAVTASHIHGPAAEVANAGVQIALPNPDFVDSCTILTEGQEADLLAGLYYVNVHTTSEAGGEIRGQILACIVPTEEASWSVVKSAY